ncbi:MAG: 23S rRNA (guanosine(2251)-2'-O)-methyltransferase RlmB [candidate division Zixibacteria bacterium]|nr:23S rRNA (guanosine(2251)-2'-O)-methyltransferase RlmB [Candidatus Tariuqbacter arcticus]
MTNDELIYGRRPVVEALNSEAAVERVILRIGAGGKIIGTIISAAKARGVRIDRLPADVFDRKFDFKASGGVIAMVSAVKAVGLEDILNRAKKVGQPPFLILLDGIEDPQNMGAIARSAEGAGCDGMVVSRRRVAPLNAAAVKASAGALLNLPVAKVANIAAAVDTLKKKGVWIFGADMDGEDYLKVDYPQSLALVIGAEGRGISRLVTSKCDRLISIPMKGKVESLNASVSAGILLFHIASMR